MERRPTRTRTTLAVCALALTLIALGCSGRTPDTITEIRRQAEQGDADAQVDLGNMYHDGDGVPYDSGEAVRWYRLAAEQGHVDAQWDLGVMYDNGRRVLKDDAEAVRWYRMAAEQGHVDAQRTLGYMYDTGDGVTENDAEAVRWYRMAAEQGDAAVQLILGFMYDTGGVPYDFVEEMRMNADGRGIFKDDAEAVKWYRMAAEQGSTTAKFKLGYMYADGRGVLKDSVIAHMWLNIAGTNGEEDARELRDSLELLMTRAEISRATELARECMASDYQDCQP